MSVQVPMIGAAGIDAALPMAACIELMAETLRALERGEVAQPIRSVIHRADQHGSLYTMPALLTAPPALAVKLITVFEGNAARSLPTHQGLVVVFDPETGTPVLLLDAAPLTAIRTAAVTAVATRALARTDAAVLAILGAGVQARSHARAIPLVRGISKVRIWSRTAAHARRLADELKDLEADVAACDAPEDAVHDADIVCTATSAHEPVLQRAWLKAGAHVNAIGASRPTSREVESAVTADAAVFVDSVDAALTEAGDLLIPLREGVTNSNSWTPIGAVLTGAAPGRRTADEITMFKSVGLAIEDTAAAAHIARQLATGTES